MAEEGKVALLTDTDQSFSQDFKREEDLFWWNERDQGRVEETIRHVEIEAGGGLTIDAGNGVVIEYKATGGDLSASLDQLSTSPGLSWVNDLRNDPALAGKVDWQAVNAEFREWDYKSQGLTEAGAALVTLVATALTAGTGGFTASLSTQLATSLGIQNAAMQTALQAGLQTLINKTAVSLVNNQGDLGATLKELGSTDTLRSLATAMVTAGLTTQVLSMAGIPDVAANTGFSQNLINEAQRNLIKAAIRAGVSMTIGGEDPGQALTSALRLAAADTVGAVLANEIGDLAAFNGLKEGSIEKVVLHAAVGCAAATIGSGECMAGAIGSGLAELIGKPLAEAIPDPARQTALLSLIAGAAGAIAGGSVDALNAAASQAATTHQNNYLNHAEMLSKLNAERALKECEQNATACSIERQSELRNEVARLKLLDELRDAELKLVCGMGNRWHCAQLLQQSHKAAMTYQVAQAEANRRGLTIADYIGSLGGQEFAAAMLDEYRSINTLRQEVSNSISARSAAELQAVLNGFGIGAAGGTLAAGGYVIATGAIPAAITCLQNPVCFNNMGIALAEAAAGDAVGGAALSIGVATGGKLLMQKGDKILGAIDQATGKIESVTDFVLSLPKGQRPDPATYLSKAEIDAHLAKFKDGAVRFASSDDVAKYGTAGPPNGGFVLPKSEFQRLVQEANGDMRFLEARLGLEKGSLAAGKTVALEIKPQDIKSLRLPSGNEGGANSSWIPGGFTAGGMPEAVMDFGGVPFTPVPF